MTAAALGTTVALETLDGAETIEIRPGTQPGQSIPLSERGVTHLRGAGRGDLHRARRRRRRPTRLDARAGGAAARAGARCAVRSGPTGQFRAGQPGFFSRLRDAFNGR